MSGLGHPLVRPLALGVVLATIVVWRLEVHRARQLRAQHHDAVTDHEVADGTRRSVTWRQRAPLPRRWPRHVRDRFSVSGRVIDRETITPVGGVEVVFTGAASATAVTDADGFYEVSVPPGRYQTSVRSERVMSVVKPRRQRPDVEAAARQRAVPPPNLAPAFLVDHDLASVDLDVVGSVVVHGRVHDSAGRPIPGALVRADVQDPDSGQPVDGADRTTTDVRGEFSLRLAAKSQQIEVAHPDYGAAAMRPIIDLGAGPVDDLDITMLAGCIISGRVTRHGRPYGVGLLAKAASLSNPQWVGAGALDPAGGFRFATDEETTIVLQAQPYKGPASEPKTFACRAGARFPDQVFEIPDRRPSITGRLVTATGAPVPRAYVDLSGTAQSSDRADDQGRLELYDLEPGEYAIVSRVPGLGVATGHATAPGGEVVLTFGGTGALHGTTRGITDGVVTLEVDCEQCLSETPTWGRTGERFLVPIHDGTYRVDGLPACKLRVTPSSGGFETKVDPVDIVAGGDTELDLDLRALVTKEVHGKVVDAEGEPVAGALVSVKGRPRLRMLTDEHGGFVMRASVGATLWVTGPGAEEEIVVPADDGSEWDVEIPIFE